MIKTRALFVLSCAMVACAIPAAAQNPNADPNFGEVSLESGFTPDPHVVALLAGGRLAARDVNSSCRGFITDAPDVRLHYEAGSLPLIISVASAADTTLVVNAPDGTFHCDDDGGVNGANPSIRFNSPIAGRYEIWVGTYQPGGTQQARLHISEVSSQ